MTRPAIARRMFLRGLAGVAVSLPFLESFAPHKALAQAGPKRMAVFFSTNGVNMERFWPKGSYGALTADMLMGTGLEPLASYASKLLIPQAVVRRDSLVMSADHPFKISVTP